jgi:hypothetical protein
MAQEFFTEGKEDAPLTFAARITYPNASYNKTPITQSVVDSITYKVFDKQTGIQTASSTFTVADTVFDTYQTGDAWRSGGAGYNFAATVPASAFPKSGKYRIEIQLSLTGSSMPIDLWINHLAAERLSS